MIHLCLSYHNQHCFHNHNQHHPEYQQVSNSIHDHHIKKGKSSRTEFGRRPEDFAPELDVPLWTIWIWLFSFEEESDFCLLFSPFPWQYCRLSLGLMLMKKLSWKKWVNVVKSNPCGFSHRRDRRWPKAGSPTSSPASFVSPRANLRNMCCVSPWQAALIWWGRICAVFGFFQVKPSPLCLLELP